MPPSAAAAAGGAYAGGGSAAGTSACDAWLGSAAQSDSNTRRDRHGPAAEQECPGSGRAARVSRMLGWAWADPGRAGPVAAAAVTDRGLAPRRLVVIEILLRSSPAHCQWSYP
jgi:hypothetical protein